MRAFCVNSIVTMALLSGAPGPLLAQRQTLNRTPLQLAIPATPSPRPLALRPTEFVAVTVLETQYGYRPTIAAPDPGGTRDYAWLIGFGVGAAVGGLIGLASAQDCTNASNSGAVSCDDMNTIFLISGAAVGAVLGLLIGLVVQIS